MPTKSSGAAVRRAEKRLIAAAMKPHVRFGDPRCRLCWYSLLTHRDDCPVLALQRARAAARKRGTR